MDKMTKNSFCDFKSLYLSVAKLIKFTSNFDEQERKAVDALESLARKMEISSYIHQKNIIAVTGMQGSGKSTLIKALYDLPDGILATNSARGEKIPVFITESKYLQNGEYKARQVIFLHGSRKENEIDVSELSATSREGGNVAYLELFVPQRYFTCENAGFVLLPGFEKNEDGKFDEDYNSLIQYALYFANAVVLATDGAGIANRDISTVTDILKKSNFDLKSLVFAITKCDTASEAARNEMISSLVEACKEAGLGISQNQVVATGLYNSIEENDSWKELLIDIINSEGVLNYNSTKREYLYYMPMIEEMLKCTDTLEKALENKTVKTESISPIYNALKTELEKREIELEKSLSIASKAAQQAAVKKFQEESKNIPAANLRTKKLLLFHKSYHEINNDKAIISNVCRRCLGENENDSFFITEVKNQLNTPEYKEALITQFNEALPPVAEIAQLNEDKDDYSKQSEYNKLINCHMTHYLVPTNSNAPLPTEGPEIGVKEVSSAIAVAMQSAFCNALFYPENLKKVQEYDIKTTSINRAIKSAQNTNNKKIPAMGIVGMLDLLDGKSDIANAIATVFSSSTATAAEIASTASTVLGVASIAIVVAMAANEAIHIYNAVIDDQKLVLEAWERAMRNAIEEQKNDCLDLFHDAGEKLLEHVQSIHRKRNHIDDTETRLINAKYAIADIRKIADKFKDQYASTISQNYGD